MSWFIPQTAAGILLAGNLYASAAVGLMSNFNYKKKKWRYEVSKRLSHLRCLIILYEIYFLLTIWALLKTY